ncbi:MAG: STAS domain-containing protein [Bacillota bacterium]|nr:STAS domain-containing protein [Bacillota bacterium]
MEAFNVTVDDSWAIISPEGKLDAYNSIKFKNSLKKALDKNCKKIIVDLTAVSFIDSTGLGVLVSTQRNVEKICLVAIRKEVKEIFLLTRLDIIFSFYDSIQDAKNAR